MSLICCRMRDKVLGRVVRLLLSSLLFLTMIFDTREGREGKKLSDDLTEQEKSGICWHVRETEAVRRLPLDCFA